MVDKSGSLDSVLSTSENDTLLLSPASEETTVSKFSSTAWDGADSSVVLSLLSSDVSATCLYQKTSSNTSQHDILQNSKICIGVPDLTSSSKDQEADMKANLQGNPHRKLHQDLRKASTSHSVSTTYLPTAEDAPKATQMSIVLRLHTSPAVRTSHSEVKLMETNTKLLLDLSTSTPSSSSSLAGQDASSNTLLDLSTPTISPSSSKRPAAQETNYGTFLGLDSSTSAVSPSTSFVWQETNSKTLLDLSTSTVSPSASLEGQETNSRTLLDLSSSTVSPTSPAEQESPVPWSDFVDVQCGGTGAIRWKDLRDSPRGGTTRVGRVKRIVNGRATRKGEVPWMAMVLANGVYQCGGSILDSRHILTAAHCLIQQVRYYWWTATKQLRPGELTVIVGNHKRDVNALQTRHDVIKIIPHPLFDNTTNDNDLAILVLNRELVLRRSVRHICLPSARDLLPRSAAVAGWGHTKRRDSIHGTFKPKFHTVLKKATLTVYLPQECRSRFRDTRPNQHQIVTDGMMCAHDNSLQGRDTCAGDSGGPLYAIPAGGQSYVQFGIVSWGYGCGVPGEPGYYTYIPHYIHWIRNILSTSSLQRDSLVTEYSDLRSPRAARATS
ncbi:hypothetical protein BaRGS_00026741 [Batillaria attramentaria]|uniref:Peptidase S1 domain-containing protein n=1 Tax=Batillaria attramentaria TaxID=370345 RepID=A0ABD0K466_9CAEN